MANVWRRAMLYLGLGPDDEYDDYDQTADRTVAPVAPVAPVVTARPAVATAREAPAPRQARPVVASSPRPATQPGTSAVRPAPREAPAPPAPVAAVPDPPVVRAAKPPPPPAAPTAPPGAAAPDAPAAPAKRGSVVRPVPAPATAKPHLVAPSSFNEAQEVADRFKAGQPVVLDLQRAERDLSRRLVDFSSGLCYGQDGQMERVANQVYLITPANVEVTAEERRRLHERGLHDA